MLECVEIVCFYLCDIKKASDRKKKKSIKGTARLGKYLAQKHLPLFAQNKFSGKYESISFYSRYGIAIQTI